jgi:hypothetical protein
MRGIARKSNSKSAVRRRGRCDSCIHAVPWATTRSIQCRHPKVIEIENQYPERKPGLIAATALNKMGKALNLKVNPDAFKREFFRWPWSYIPNEIEACQGCE